MKCIDCINYIPIDENRDEAGCANDGDVTNPEEDVYCGEMDDSDFIEKTKDEPTR